MVKQYPHKMILTIIPGGQVQDENGDFGPASPVTVEKECRADASGGNGYVSGPGGTRINYSYVVYMPLPVDTIETGTLVEVQDPANNNETILRDKVLQFYRGQLNARVWL
jgi:hypothetical protein